MAFPHLHVIQHHPASFMNTQQIIFTYRFSIFTIIAGPLVPYNHACPKWGLIHRDRVMQLMKQALYLQGSKPPWWIKFKLLWIFSVVVEEVRIQRSIHYSIFELAVCRITGRTSKVVDASLYYFGDIIWGRIKGLKLQRFDKLNFTYHGKLRCCSGSSTVVLQ